MIITVNLLDLIVLAIGGAALLICGVAIAVVLFAEHCEKLNMRKWEKEGEDEP